MDVNDPAQFQGKDAYQVLGLTEQEVCALPTDKADGLVRGKYRRLCLKYHPDKGCTNDDLMKTINASYAAVKDAAARSTYRSDQERERAVRSTHRQSGVTYQTYGGGGFRVNIPQWFIPQRRQFSTGMSTYRVESIRRLNASHPSLDKAAWGRWVKSQFGTPYKMGTGDCRHMATDGPGYSGLLSAARVRVRVTVCLNVTTRLISGRVFRSKGTPTDWDLEFTTLNVHGVTALRRINDSKGRTLAGEVVNAMSALEKLTGLVAVSDRDGEPLPSSPLAPMRVTLADYRVAERVEGLYRHRVEGVKQREQRRASQIYGEPVSMCDVQDTGKGFSIESMTIERVPVTFLLYSWKGTPYYLWMNNATGEMAGTRPLGLLVKTASVAVVGAVLVALGAVVGLGGVGSRY
ncbi:hypothetical protein KIPB_008627 [Kipferlia bialata]|uniref:J domain-containing protein n=1 Tax=Kipferlia bialata TaxID=797122 RepID=A0A9K3D2N3_9EUKA|nr:hypothetical protein KIPB_008627 [Kipferlia bialata]|eukprot:g8627.t1